MNTEPRGTVQFHLNAHAAITVPRAGFGPETRRPLHAHTQLPDYRRTPLFDLPEVARDLGVASLRLKDESQRMGLPSFKILGASWAVLTAVAESWLPEVYPDGPLKQWRSGLRQLGGERRLLAATDGNHGRGVARMAALLDVGAHILVPRGTAAPRIDAITAEGASVHVVDGSYNDAVAASAALADESSLVVSDTSWAGYERIPRAVIDGYSTLFFEIDDQIARRGWEPPTLVAVQAGVGAFAAAAERHYRRPGARSARTLVVEPTTANCLMVSARATEITEVPGPHTSAMAGLNCGLPSLIAWPVIARGTDAFVAIEDEYAYEAMRRLAAEGIEAGESGAAALGGLLALAAHPQYARAAGLDDAAHVLVVNTEGATDPENYRAVVGSPAMRAAGAPR